MGEGVALVPPGQVLSETSFARVTVPQFQQGVALTFQVCLSNKGRNGETPTVSLGRATGTGCDNPAGDELSRS